LSENRPVEQRKEANPAQGRVDLVAAKVFDRLLERYGNPMLKAGSRMFAEEIQDCFTENLGPGTKAHRVGSRLLRAVEGQR
jgi:hypothetical protein